MILRAKAFDADKLPWAEFAASLRPALTDLVDNATAGAIDVAVQRGLRIDPAGIATSLARMLPGYVDAWLIEVQATTQADIEAAHAAYKAGVIDIDGFYERVDHSFDDARASLIATTENTRVYDVVNDVIFHEAGVEKVRFLTVRDPWVDEICQGYDEQVFDIDDAPGIPEDTHPNCRCFYAPEVPEARSRQPVTV